MRKGSVRSVRDVFGYILRTVRTLLSSIAAIYDSWRSFERYSMVAANVGLLIRRTALDIVTLEDSE